MKRPFNRRDFLKLAGLVSAGAALPQIFTKPAQGPTTAQTPNVLVIVFDSWSAYHTSLYGFGRRTTPNIERLAEKATVYHNHISGGNFTLPGTTSLLTGMLSWKHRTFGYPIDLVKENFLERNLFHMLPDYHRMAYTHNRLADGVLQAMFADIDELTPLSKYILHNDYWVEKLFSVDEDTATVSFLRAIKAQENNPNYSLFLSKLYQANVKKEYNQFIKSFPLGLPRYNIDNFFVLEEAIDWLNEMMPTAVQPFLGYFHFLPPHAPYNTRKDFFQTFAKDKHVLIQKPDVFYTEGTKYPTLIEESRMYDEYILYVDSEFARLYESLERSGVLENTWLILTSDHGELFERGIRGHGTPLLYHSLINVPLLIFAPGQTSRTDIYENTSAVDLLPTVLKITGKESTIPAWTEGRVLPPFGTSTPRDIFVVEGRGTVQNKPMPHGTITAIRENYKLIYYFGYPELGEIKEKFELFDLENDPEELNDLSEALPNIAADLLETVKTKLETNEQPFK